jgi:branched-chain amino acid transport system ATP-binding protein
VSLLSIESLDVRHGLLRAVRDVTVQVSVGETLAIVGANGAGKTTLLRALAGAHRPAGGRIVFEGHDITALPAHRRVRAGVALVPEGRRLFPDLTVEENLLVGAAARRRGPWSVDAVMEAFPILAPLRHERASTLSGGEQHATAIGRSLMTNPKLLLLDEVSLGLAPVAIDGVYASLRTVIASGATTVIVEQDLARAMSVATRIVCMLEGRVVLEGEPGVLSRGEIINAYFGLRRPRRDGLDA